MPKMDGIEVAHAIHRLGLRPIIVAISSSVDRRLADEQLFHAFTAKPIRRGHLLHVICSLFSETPAVLDSSSDSRIAHEGTRRRHLKVLIVEDNETNRQVLSTLLRNMDCAVTEACNGADALDRMSDDFDVVLMDVHMPVLDGVTTTRLMREKGFSVPIVVITADVTDDTREQCENAGAEAVLLKPVKKEQVAQVLQGLVKPRRKVAENVHHADKKKVCLVADDVESNRLAAAHLIRQVWGPSTILHFAKDGAEAVELASSTPIDLILMDIAMPVMGGIQAAQRLKALGIDTQIVAVTGSDDPQTLSACKAVGIDDVVVKPLKKEDVKRLIDSFESEGQNEEATQSEERLFDDSFLADLDTDMKRSILASWRMEMIRMWDEMKQLEASENWMELRNVAHAAKGACFQIGANRLGRMARDLESISKSNSSGDGCMGRLLDDMKQAMETTFQYLKM